MGAETKYKTNLRKSSRAVNTARSNTWGLASKAPMMRHRPGEEVTRANPFKEGEDMTFCPEPKFTFINKHAFNVAASGAMMHSALELRDRSAVYRTWCPEEPELSVAFPTFSAGAKAMLSHFLQSYAAECGTYARYVERAGKDGMPPTRINRKMMGVAMDIADSKIFDAAAMRKTQIFVGPDKPSATQKNESKASSSEEAKDATKAPKTKKANKEKTKKADKADKADKSIKKSKPSKEKKMKQAAAAGAGDIEA